MKLNKFVISSMRKKQLTNAADRMDPVIQNKYKFSRKHGKQK